MVAAKNAKLDLSAVLSSDERAVIETHPHSWRLYARAAVDSVISIVCFLLGLSLYRLVWSWVRDVPNVPQVPTWLVEAYEYFFADYPWWATGLLVNVSVIVLFFAAAFSDTRMEYFATNKRIIWWNKHSGKVADSIPLTSIKMVRLGRWKRAKHGRYGDIVFSVVTKSEYPYMWLRITEPESVLRRLQAMTPESDPGYVRKHLIIGWTLFSVGAVLMFGSLIFLCYSVVMMGGEAGLIFGGMFFGGMVVLALCGSHIVK